MARMKRPELRAEAQRRNLEQLARLGGQVGVSRRRKRLTQEELGDRADLDQSTISRMERGLGGQLSLDAWQRVALALDRPLRVELGRDPNE